jgi:hypothetical protein
VRRQKEPGLERPFRVWGSTAALVAVCAPAVVIALLTIYLNAVDDETVMFVRTSFTVSSFTIGWYTQAG